MCVRAGVHGVYVCLCMCLCMCMRGGDDDDDDDDMTSVTLLLAVGVCVLVRAARVRDVWCVCVWFVSVLAMLAVLVAGDDATRRSWMTERKYRGVVVLCCCWRYECVGLSWVEFV